MIGILIGAVIQGLIGGLVIMLASKPILKMAVPFGQGFKIAAIAAVASGLVNLILSFVLPPNLAIAGGLVGLAVGFAALFIMTKKETDAPQGPALILSAIVIGVYFVIGLIFAVLLAGLVVAAGAAGAAGSGSTPMILPF